LQVPKDQLCKLLAHGLPLGVAEAELRSLLPASAPPLVRVEGDCSTQKKVFLVFSNPQDANQAFKELQVSSSPFQNFFYVASLLLVCCMAYHICNSLTLESSPFSQYLKVLLESSDSLIVLSGRVIKEWTAWGGHRSW
jgi:hypothetical protein